MQFTASSLFDKLEKFSSRIHAGFSKIESAVGGKRKLGVFAFMLLLLWVFMFILNLKTPLLIDDFHYSFASGGGRVSSMADIFKTQYEQYFLWGGRAIVHVIAQTLLFVNPIVADVLNSFMYVIYTLLIYFHIVGKSKKHSIFTLLMVIALSFVLQPAFGETCLWLTGSANYLWGTSILLAFLLPYRFYAGDNKGMQVLKVVGMFVLGLLAGWTNENTVSALLVMLFLFILSYRLRGYKLPIWAVAGFVGAIIGFLFMILAPGNMVRTEVIGLDGTVTIMHILKTFVFSTLQIVEWFGVLNLILIAALILLMNKGTDKALKVNTSIFVSIYLLGSLVALYVMSFSPFFPTRSWFGVLTFNIIALGIALYSLDYSTAILKRIKQYATIFFIVWFLDLYYVAYTDISFMNNVWQERIVAMENNKEGDEVLEFKFQKNKTRYSVEDSIYFSEIVSKYYGAKVLIK